MPEVQGKALEHEFREGYEGAPGEDYPGGSASVGRGYRHHAESLEAYLATISRAPLLSPAAEWRLARRVREGCPKA